jgi:hypothetical protein
MVFSSCSLYRRSCGLLGRLGRRMLCLAVSISFCASASQGCPCHLLMVGVHVLAVLEASALAVKGLHADDDRAAWERCEKSCLLCCTSFFVSVCNKVLMGMRIMLRLALLAWCRRSCALMENSLVAATHSVLRSAGRCCLTARYALRHSSQVDRMPVALLAAAVDLPQVSRLGRPVQMHLQLAVVPGPSAGLPAALQ